MSAFYTSFVRFGLTWNVFQTVGLRGFEDQISKAKSTKVGNVRNADVLDTEVGASVWVQWLPAYCGCIG